MPRVLTGSRGPWFGLLAIALLFAVLASRTGTDTDWDLRNYHAYNAHALLNGRFWTDVAPAQLQTFHSPVLDIPIGAIRDRLNGAPVVLNIVLAMPHALAVWLAFVLTLRVVPANLPGRTLAGLAATLFGATGAAGLPLLASAQDDMLPGSCILGGLLFLTSDWGRPAASAGCAGLLFGVAAGLKLTAVPYCAAGAVALLLVPQQTTANRLRPLAAYVAAGLFAGCLLAGPWCALLFERYRNPILPYMNQWFRSPFVDPLAFTDERFKPHGLIQAVTYPVFWAVRPVTLVSELPVRDARFAIAWLALLGLLACHVLRRRAIVPCVNRAGLLLSVFFAAGFAFWELASSVFRYLATLELLAGTMVLIALRPLLERRRLRVPIALGCAAAGVAVAATAVYPDWGRMTSPRPVRIAMPDIEPGSLVILLDRSPMAYLADAVPPAIPFVGANNNLIQPGKGGLLSRQAEDMIRTHAGPLYGLEEPSESPGIADQTLAYYGLARDGCAPVASNLDDNAIRLCRLTAAHSHPPS
jgi:hypothetical protein